MKFTMKYKMCQPLQLNLTLNHVDSPYIRAIGFLYLRYVGQPDQIYKWIAPYLQDEEEFLVLERPPRDLKRQQQSRDGSYTITMGAFVRYIFQSRDYYGQTPLPRWPLAVERQLGVELLAADDISERAQQHTENPSRMDYFTKVGSRVMALYGDEDNPVTWYEAVIDRVISRDEATSAHVLKYPRFVVTFTEYGNTETVHLGEIDRIGGAASSTHDSSGRDGKRGGGYHGDSTRAKDHTQRFTSRDNAEQEMRRREQERVTAESRGSSRTFHKSSSSHRQQSYSDSQRRSRDIRDDNRHARSDSERNSVQQSSAPSSATAEASRKRSAEESAAIAERKRKLMAKYG